jgi:hypothetical protein
MSAQSASPSPSSEYDFILKDKTPTKKGISLPSGGLKLAFMILGAVLVIFVLIVIFATVLKPGASGGQELVNISARAQEIIRVSKITESLAQNSDTQGLIATTEAALMSDQAQLASYFSQHRIKANDKTLSIYLDKNADSQMQTAAQNNSLDSTYSAYLKKNLTAYEAALEAAFPHVSVSAKDILSASFNSTQALLAAPQVKGASS